MKEFTEKHHAFIAATFYDLLTKRYGQRGEAALFLRRSAMRSSAATEWRKEPSAMASR